MYGSILNQVEPSVNLYSQTTQPSSYYGIWTTTLGVNQVTFVKDLESSTISGYNSNVMIIKQLDNKNKYKTKLIRTMQIDENSDTYFSGCTINNGQANQIYYGTGYSWILVNNEYTPPSGGGGGLSYNLFAQETEPDTYDGIWTTNTDITSLGFVDTNSNVIDTNELNINLTSFMSMQAMVVDEEYVYIVSGIYTTTSYQLAGVSGFGTNFILKYNLNTKEFIETITIPNNTGMYYHSCIIHNSKLYIVGGRFSTTATDVINKIIIYDLITKNFTESVVIPKVDSVNLFIYNNSIYIVGGYVINESNARVLSTSIYIYNIENNTYSTVSSPYTLSECGCIYKDGYAYFIAGTQNGAAINRILKYEPSTNTWNIHKYTDFYSISRNLYCYYNNKLYTIPSAGATPRKLPLCLESDLSVNGLELEYTDPILERVGYASICNIDNLIYLIGGLIGSTYYNSVFIYDIISKTYISGPTYPTNISRCTLHTIKRDNEIYIYALGGSISGSVYSNAIYVYITSTGTWTKKADIPLYITYHSSVYFDKFIYIFGGYASTTSGGSTSYNTISYRYNVDFNTISQVVAFPSTLVHSTTVVRDDGFLYTFGGINSAGTYPRLIYRYDIKNNTFATFSFPYDVKLSADSAVVSNTVYIIGESSLVYDLYTVEVGYTRNTILPPMGLYAKSIYYNGYIYIISRAAGYTNSIMRFKVSKPVILDSNTVNIIHRDSTMIEYNGNMYCNFCGDDASAPQKSKISNIYKFNFKGTGSYDFYMNIKSPKCCTNAYIYEDKLYITGKSSRNIVNSEVYIYDMLNPDVSPIIACGFNGQIGNTTHIAYNRIYSVCGHINSISTLSTYILIYTISDVTINTSLNTQYNLGSTYSRVYHTSCMYEDYIYIVGGFTDVALTVSTTSLLKYDTKYNILTTMSVCPKDIAYAQSVNVGSNMYVVFGYQPSTTSFNSDILLYNTLTDTWSTDLTTSISLINHRVIVRGTDIFIFGGEDNLGTHTNKVYKYDTLLKELVEVTPLPFTAINFGVAYWESRDIAVLCGGILDGVESSDIMYYYFDYDESLNLKDPTELVISQYKNYHNHSTKLITGNNMKVSFTDVFINSEEPYDVYKGDGTQWIKIT